MSVLKESFPKKGSSATVSVDLETRDPRASPGIILLTMHVSPGEKGPEMQFIVKHTVVTSYHSQWYSFYYHSDENRKWHWKAVNLLEGQSKSLNSTCIIFHNQNPAVSTDTAEWVCCSHDHIKPIVPATSAPALWYLTEAKPFIPEGWMVQALLLGS